MAFIPVKRSVASFPVAVLVYGDSGQKQTIEFTAQYRRHKQSELDHLSDSIANKIRKVRGDELIARKDGTTPVFKFETNIDFLAEVMTGWSGVVDEHGQPRPFSPEALRELLDDYPELTLALSEGFWGAHRKVVEKN